MLGLFLPERRYASADTSYGPISVSKRVGVCLSVTSRCSIKTKDGSSWFLAWRLLLTCPTL